MTDIGEKFVDRVKSEVLYEQFNNDDVSQMLSYSPTNRNLSTELAKITASLNFISSSFTGKYKDLLTPFIEDLEIRYLTISGETREQAIRMRAEVARIEQEKKKGGLLGLFGGGNNV